jgi:hypothetical protein
MLAAGARDQARSSRLLKDPFSPDWRKLGYLGSPFSQRSRILGWSRARRRRRRSLVLGPGLPNFRPMVGSRSFRVPCPLHSTCALAFSASIRSAVRASRPRSPPRAREVWREISTQDLAVMGQGFYPMCSRAWLSHVDGVFVPLCPNTPGWSCSPSGPPAPPRCGLSPGGVLWA